jgi:hypothetical protein
MNSMFFPLVMLLSREVLPVFCNTFSLYFHFLCCISLVGRVFGNIQCVGPVGVLQLVSEE